MGKDYEIEFICWMECYKGKKWTVYDWNNNKRKILNREEFFKEYNLDIENLNITNLYISPSEKVIILSMKYNTYIISILD